MAQHNGQVAVVAGGFEAVGTDAEETAAGEFDLRNLEKLPARDVPVSALSPGPHLRQSGTNAAHVQSLIDTAGSAELPPVLVQEDGWRVIDGLHRLEAARLRGDQGIKARFLDCTDSEALVLAMKANSSHGLPLSKADRVSGAKRVLTAHPDWSDRAIAGITGLSAKTIASLRGQLGAGAHPGGKRLGRDGRRRPVTAGEGRRRAAEYIIAHPDAPLRQVARETDVSLGTVHDVSARLRRGVSPERNGHRARAARPDARPDSSPEAQPQDAGPRQARPRSIRPQNARSRDAQPEDARPEEVRPEEVRPQRTRPQGVRPITGVAGALAVPGTVTGAPAPTGMPLRRRNHTGAPLTWAGVAAKVANDPAVKYSEGGKEFLRWMAMHATDPDGWRELLNAIPAHWLSVLAPIADGISQEWGLFAERLKNKQETGR